MAARWFFKFLSLSVEPLSLPGAGQVRNSSPVGRAMAALTVLLVPLLTSRADGGLISRACYAP